MRGPNSIQEVPEPGGHVKTAHQSGVLDLVQVRYADPDVDDEQND